MLASNFWGFFMPFYAYILKSEKDNGFYYGHCQNLQQRLLRHNAGKVRSTKSRRPFIIHYFEEFDTKNQALTSNINPGGSKPRRMQSNGINPSAQCRLVKK